MYAILVLNAHFSDFTLSLGIESRHCIAAVAVSCRVGVVRQQSENRRGTQLAIPVLLLLWWQQELDLPLLLIIQLQPGKLSQFILLLLLLRSPARGDKCITDRPPARHAEVVFSSPQRR